MFYCENKTFFTVYSSRNGKVQRNRKLISESTQNNRLQRMSLYISHTKFKINPSIKSDINAANFGRMVFNKPPNLLSGDLI